MKLYKFKEQTGPRLALSPEQNPDGLQSGAWALIGEVDIQRGGGPRIGAGSDEILDGIDQSGIFILPNSDI